MDHVFADLPDVYTCRSFCRKQCRLYQRSLGEQLRQARRRLESLIEPVATEAGMAHV